MSRQNNRKLGELFRSSDPDPDQENEYPHRHSTASTSSQQTSSSEASPSPYLDSPWNQPSPFVNSPWITSSSFNYDQSSDGLIGSIHRQAGHIYSLAASRDLLYTGSDSKNIRVWKNLNEFTSFKSNSGLVKAIVISGDRVFTGHQDGKIRIWKVSSKNHKRIGSLPTFIDHVKSSISPKDYVQVRRHRNVLRIKHYDAISCLSLNEEQGLLYSASWDKTLKVWQISNSRCVETIRAHDDAINTVACGFDSLVFTGSADGTVKVWRRELQGRGTKHFLVKILLKQDKAVTSIAVNRESGVIYSGYSDGLVNFWERENHLSHGGILRGHKMAVLCLATAGNMVFSGSTDKSICVWKREDEGGGGGVHTCLHVLTGHEGPVKCLAVNEDQTYYKGARRWIVYSGSLDKSVKLWRVSGDA